MILEEFIIFLCSIDLPDCRLRRNSLNNEILYVMIEPARQEAGSFDFGTAGDTADGRERILTAEKGRHPWKFIIIRSGRGRKAG